MDFLNSLIIHKAKTKKITTVKVVWISDTNYHKILRSLSFSLSKNYCSFEKLYQKLHSLFHPIPRHLELGLTKLGCASFFNPVLGVWISDETLHVLCFNLKSKRGLSIKAAIVTMILMTIIVIRIIIINNSNNSSNEFDDIS